MTEAQHLLFAVEWMAAGVALTLYVQAVLRRAMGRTCPRCRALRAGAERYREAVRH